jgi:anti-anti-sigma factor
MTRQRLVGVLKECVEPLEQPVVARRRRAVSQRPIVVRCVGDLDFATQRVVHSDLADAMSEGDGPVVADCQNVTFLDSSGLRELVWARLAAAGRSFSVENPSVAARRTLERTGLTDMLNVRDA